MTTNFDSMQATLLLILILSASIVAVAIAYKKKLLVNWGKALDPDPEPDLPLQQSHYYTRAAAELLPPLIDHPDPLSEEEGYFETGDDDIRYELMEDEDLSLLKTAEAIVGDIQVVVNNIASHPANPDEICSKIHYILRDMGILQQTEYYDAINSFISVTVKRDCDLELTRDDIQALWVAEAA